MEASRAHLREKLVSIMEECGETSRLYFQPNESFHMEYPCIVYHLKDLRKRTANNEAYLKAISFDITYITRDPTSEVPDKLLSTRYFSFDRYYTADNLHHYAYTYSENLRKG